jgi:hypothetical protein
VQTSALDARIAFGNSEHLVTLSISLQDANNYCLLDLQKRKTAASYWDISQDY